MATNPRFPEEPERPQIVERHEHHGPKRIPWGLVAAIITIAIAIAIAWYFFH